MLSDLQYRLLKISGTVTCRYGFFGSPDLSIWVPGADMWCTKPGAATAHPGTFHADAILESTPFSNMRRVKLSTFLQWNFSFGCQWSEADYLHLHKPSRVGKSPHPVNTSRGESILNSKCVYEGMRQIESYQMHQVSKNPIGHLACLIRVLRLIWASIVAPTTTLVARSAPGFVCKWFRLGMDYNALDFPNRLSQKKRNKELFNVSKCERRNSQLA